MYIDKNDLIWNSISGLFQPKEFGIEHGGKIRRLLVELLLDVRAIWNKPLIVLAGLATTGHADKSYHYTDPPIREGADAVDFIIPAVPFSDVFVRLINFKDIRGIGLYSNWRYKGEATPGFHIDTRPSGLLWYRDQAGQYYYNPDGKTLIRVLQMGDATQRGK